MKEEIEKFLNEHELLKNNVWLVIFLLFIFNRNQEINIEELNKALTIIEQGNIDLLKEEINNEQPVRNVENDKKS